MFDSLKRRLRREAFLVSPLAILINPFYIIRRGLLRAVREVAPGFTGRLLDFGCGSKPYRSLFTQAAAYIGVDLKVSGHDHKNSQVDVFYDGRHLPFGNAEFDAVVSFEVFEHVFEPDEALAEIHRVLRPDGLLLLTVPFAWDEHEVPYDFARYTSFGLVHLLKRNGFEVTVQRKTTTYVLAICQLFIAYLVQYVLPRRGVLKRLAQLVIVCPLTLLSLALDALLPSSQGYFCNNLVVARRMQKG